MVLPLFDHCAVFWDSCGQGSKSYLDKLNHRAACIIEGHVVNGLMNFLPYLSGPICRRAVTSLNLSFSISGSPSYQLSEFRLLTNSTPISQENMISYSCLWPKPPSTRAVFGLPVMVPVPIIPSPPILELLKTSISLSP